MGKRNCMVLPRRKYSILISSYQCVLVKQVTGSPRDIVQIGKNSRNNFLSHKGKVIDKKGFVAKPADLQKLFIYL